MKNGLSVLNCPCCGGSVRGENGAYVCDYCGKSFLDKSPDRYADEIRILFGEALYEDKCERVAALRRNLYSALHAENIESREITEICRAIKQILPDDFQACFYELANSGTQSELNSFILNADPTAAAPFAEDMTEFMLKSLENSNVLPLKEFIGRSFSGAEYIKYITAVEDEAEKLKKGLYSPQVPRDVFLAYSSKDAEAVSRIVGYLEEQNITCFVALRNLRHGRGAVENYLEALRTAMRNCRCVVFLSSENSRDLECDALKTELPYIAETQPQMGRIEYLLEEYGGRTSYAARRVLEKFFEGLEYCRTEEDLVDRIVGYITGVRGRGGESARPAEYKYCVHCKNQVTAGTEVCPSCGGKEFFSGTLAEFGEYMAMRNPERPTMGEKIRRGVQSVFGIIQGSVEETRSNAAKMKDFRVMGGELIVYKGSSDRVFIPDGVQRISSGAFGGNNTVTEITSSGTTRSVEKKAFSKCGGLKRVNFASGLTAIEGKAFSECPSLTEVYIPATVNYMGKKVFKKCGAVTAYCEAETCPSGWNKKWNKSGLGKKIKVVWGYRAPHS